MNAKQSVSLLFSLSAIVALSFGCCSKRIVRHGDGWLTYFYTPESFRKAWARLHDLAREGGRDPAELRNVSQLPICVARTFEEADRGIREFIGRYFDVAPWSESTPDSAIRGTPDQCAEQLARHAVSIPAFRDTLAAATWQAGRPAMAGTASTPRRSRWRRAP